MVIRCVYRDEDGKQAKEHVWPRWVRKHAREVMGIDPPNTQRYRGTQEHRGKPPKVKSERKGGGRLSLTIPDVCEGCNGGWMKQLEDDTKPMLLPMIEGKARKLSSGHLLVLSPADMDTSRLFQ
jgi:hypothetical protein